MKDKDNCFIQDMTSDVAELGFIRDFNALRKEHGGKITITKYYEMAEIMFVAGYIARRNDELERMK